MVPKILHILAPHPKINVCVHGVPTVLLDYIKEDMIVFPYCHECADIQMLQHEDELQRVSTPKDTV
jgi:hypothetical protein